jgi:hypothetical protein
VHVLDAAHLYRLTLEKAPREPGITRSPKSVCRCVTSRKRSAAV